MLLVDDLLTAPVKGLSFVFRSVHDAVEENIEEQKQQLRDELNELYMLLERGEVTEETFDEREEEILDQLDELDELEQEVSS